MTGLDSVLAAVKSLFAAHPDMQAFVDWPDDTPTTGKMMRHIPATDIVAGFDRAGTDSTQPLISVRKRCPIVLCPMVASVILRNLIEREG